MILSKARMDKLLEIFENPKSISPYNNYKEKEVMQETLEFINNYHQYGPPMKYNKTNVQTNGYKTTSNNISRNPSLINQKSSILNDSRYDVRKLKNAKDMEIKRSIENLSMAQEQYLKKKHEKDMKWRSLNNTENNAGISAYPVNTYSSEYEKNQNIYNNLLNSSGLSLTQSRYDYNNYDTNTFVNKYPISSKLSYIPANPEDVIIQQIPPNYSVSINPISSCMGASNINNIPKNISSMPLQQSIPISPPKMIEEINTDIINNVENENNPQIVEPPKEEKKEGSLSMDFAKEEEQQQPQSAGKYQITEFNGPITVPQGYSTDDVDEFNAVQILNEDKSSWNKQIDKPNIKVFTKRYKVKNDKGKEDDNVMFYTEATFVCPARDLYNQVSNLELRKNWDENLKKGKFLREENLGNGIKVQYAYNYIKMPLLFDDRDMVTRRKIWENYQGENDCYLMETHDIDDPNYPPTKNPVRATCEIRSDYIKPIDNNKCQMFYVSKFNMKVSAPLSMMERKGSSGQQNFVEKITKQISKS